MYRPFSFVSFNLVAFTYTFIHFHSLISITKIYRIAGKIGGDFNLAVWRITRTSPYLNFANIKVQAFFTILPNLMPAKFSRYTVAYERFLLISSGPIVIDTTTSTTSMLPTIPSIGDTGGLNPNDCRAFGSVNVISAVIAVLIAIIIILVIVVLVLAIVLVKNKRHVKLLYSATAGDALGVINNVYDEVQTPSHTATAVTFGQTTFDGHEMEKEDPYAQPKNVTEKDPESGQFVGRENETTKL